MTNEIHGDEAASVKAGFLELPEGEVWLTNSDQSALFQRQQQPLRFDDTAQGFPAIPVDAGKQYQTLEGFGFSLTGGSAYLISRLPLLEKEALLQELFSSEGNGIGISYLRLTLGASDLSKESFSYDEVPQGEMDKELLRFDIFAGDVEVIPLLKEILVINPSLKIMASPWSAPRWMKANHQWMGGTLRPDCFSAYARYFVKYIQAMNGHGIPIHAITPQNEPLNHKNEPSMVMAPHEQAAFIKGHLGPALRDAGLEGVEIFCWDHNCDVRNYPLSVLADPDARQFIAGVAWHLYGGDISALSEVQAVYPDKKMVFTEQWVGRDGKFAGDLNWHVKNVLVGACRNWSRVVLEWNLASDPDCGPHTPGGEPNCVGALTIGERIERNVSYYVIAHVAKWVRPGSVRIFSDSVDFLPNMAFRTADDTIVLVVLNDSPDRRVFTIQYQGKFAATGLEGGSVGTYLWPM